MKKLILLLLSVSLYAKIVPYAGVAMNGNMSNSEQYIISESPLGIFGINYETKYISVGYKHISSIPQIDETQGINEFNLNAKYKYKFIEPYIGVSYTNDKLTSKYYMNQSSKISAVVGTKILYKDKNIFFEYRDSKNKDMLMYGIILEFYPEDLSW